MELRTKTRKWGSSLAVILPKALTEMKNIRENEEVIVEVKKPLLAREVFGMFPRTSKKTAQQIRDEMRSGW